MKAIEQLRGVATEKPAKAIRTRSGSSDDGLFTKANGVDTIAVLDQLGISHTSTNRGEMATCPGCGEDGALVCVKGGAEIGLKCLHERCSKAGPRNNPGFRTNVDLVAHVQSIEPADAARVVCEWFGIEVKTNGNGHADHYEHTDGDAPDAPPVASVTQVAELVWREASAVFAPLPPTRWISAGLHIGPGRPAMLAGYGASGKTIASQALALAVASGVPAWGNYPVTIGKVLHVDHEQGWHATAKRYQRLSRGMDLHAAELDGTLRVCTMPDVYLTDPLAVDAYSRASEGVALVIIDALRGATPGLDENDSRIRICLDNLTRVSEKTGAAFWILHHAGKPKETHADARTVVRGSSAIFDACGAVYVLSGSKGLPKLMSEQKVPAEAEGAPIDDFELVIEDVLVGTNPTGGVRVLARQGVEPPRLGPTPKLLAQAEAIALVVRANPGCTRNFIRAQIGGNSKLTDDALDWMVGAQRLEQREGPRRALLHFEVLK